MGHMERPQIIVSNLEDLFPLTVTEIFLIFFRITLYISHKWRVIWPQGKNSNETINEFDEVVYVNHMHPFLYRTY